MTTTSSTSPDIDLTAGDDTTAEQFAERLFQAVLGAQLVQALYVGQQLGWYDALVDQGPISSVQLAAATGTDERYAREWLEHQAVCGILTVDAPAASPTERRYTIPAAQQSVLTDRDSLLYVAPLASFTVAAGQKIDRYVEAYRTGGGISWDELGDTAREAQSAANRPLFLRQLGQELLPQLPALHARLTAGARIADIGSGFGWSSIGMALAYPSVTVDGFDIDQPSVDAARRNAEEHGVADRVRFEARNAAYATGIYDAVFAFECIHDLSDPVAVLRSMRALAGPDGVVIVMDENVAEQFTAPGDDVERIMYGYSLFCCLPDGMSTQPSAATGTVMRPDTLRRYATEAGFADVEVLPLENDFFRFYQLHS